MSRRPLFPAALAWLGGILILASGCADQSPTALDLNSAGTFQAQLPAAVTPMRAAAPFGAGVYSAKITPAGGTIDFGIGTITFPKHAVDNATVITARVDGENMAVEFAPHGLTFPRHAQPTLSFRHGGALAGNEAFIYYVDEQFRPLETLVATIDETNQSAWTKLEHFSPYILGAS